MNKNIQINTDCETCVFAKWKSGMQVGCELNRLERFAQTGTEIQTVEKDGKKSFMLMDRYCNTHRQQDWAERFADKKLSLRVLEEVQIKIKVFVYVNAESTLADVERTIKSIAAQTIKPHVTEVIYNHATEVKSAKILALLKQQKIKFKLTKITEENVGLWRCLDICHKKTDSIYYSIFVAGFALPEDYIEKVNSSINFEMNRFVMLRPYDESYNGLLVHSRLHKKLGKSRDNESIVSFIEMLADEQQMQHMVQEVRDVCPIK